MKKAFEGEKRWGKGLSSEAHMLDSDNGLVRMGVGIPR